MRVIKKGATDQSVVIRIVDSGDGTPETGVTSATSGLDLKYRREGAVTANLTESDLSALNDAHSDGGMLHIGAGYYRIDLPDAAVATGSNGCLVFGTVTGMVVIGCYIHLVDYDAQDTVRLGLGALPNAAADAAGGLPISDAGGLDLDSKLANTNEVTAARMGALTDWIDGGRLDLIIDAILVDTGTTLDGKIDTIDTNVDSILADTGTDGVVLATGSITAAVIATGAIDADAIAADAIGASEIASDAGTEIANAVWAKTLTELSAVPGVTAAVLDALNFIFTVMRNKIEQTATEQTLYKDDGTTAVAESTTADDGATYTKGEWAAP